MLIINRGEKEITGLLDGKPFSIPFEKITFEALKVLEAQMSKVENFKDKDSIAEKVKELIEVDYNTLVTSKNPYLMHNADRDEYYLIVNKGKTTETISDIPLPQILVDYIHKSVDKNIDYMPLMKAWKNFLLSRMQIRKDGSFKLTKYEEFLNTTRFFATFLDTEFVDNEMVDTLIDAEGYSIERATEKATYRDISITQEGILSCYKVADEVIEKWQLTYDEEGNVTGKTQVPMHKTLTSINELSGEVTEVKETTEFQEDRYFKPAIHTTGEDFYSDGVLGQSYRVGQTQWLGRDATINRQNTFGGGGLYIGGLNYIQNYGGDSRKTLSCFINPADIISFQSEGNAIRVRKLFPNNVIEDSDIKLKSIYHSSKYLADSLGDLQAEMKAAAVISKEATDAKTLKKTNVLKLLKANL